MSRKYQSVSCPLEIFVSIASNFRSATITRQFLDRNTLLFNKCAGLEVVYERATSFILFYFFSCFKRFGGRFSCKQIVTYLRKLNEGKKNPDACLHTTSNLNGTSILAIFLGAKFNKTSRNDWKALCEIRKYSTKTIRLFAFISMG